MRGLRLNDPRWEALLMITPKKGKEMVERRDTTPRQEILNRAK